MEQRDSRQRRRRGGLAAWAAAACCASVCLTAPAAASAGTAVVDSQRYTVLLAGTQTVDGFSATGTSAAVAAAVQAAGGTIANDLSKQIGVLSVTSPNLAFAQTLQATGLVESVGRDFKWQAFSPGRPAPDSADEPTEALQWDMQQIQSDAAHDIQAGRGAVDVGILDSGIDGRHVDFTKGGVSNVDCARGRNSVSFLPDGPGVGTPDPCIDNQFHGTHVAGTVGARANGAGIVGVAPNVTLVPVKVCDASGYCYAGGVVDGITYAGDARLDVINMSFFVDDDTFQESHEFKCMDDPVQRTFRRAVERAIRYARDRGVTPVAALGNSDNDLANPPAPYDNSCEVVPAESPGVIGVGALGPESGKASYSNYGFGEVDVVAPGGDGDTGDCTRTILSTIPGAYFCIQGTSMASPHAAGVAALIVSQFGKLGSDGDVKIDPETVQKHLQSSSVDIGLKGYDECFGHGRINALRAVKRDGSRRYDAAAPFCPEYAE